MDWSNERYVRLYTRDTAEWLAMCWQAKALLPLLLRKADRAGVVQVKPGPQRTRLIAGLTGLPPEVVEAGLADLLLDGCLVESDLGFAFRNYEPAQEATASAKKRAEESRAARKAKAMQAVTKRDEQSQNVTDGHDSSRFVTPSHAVPSHAVPSRKAKEEALSAGADAPPLLALAVQSPPPPKPDADAAVYARWRELYAPRAAAELTDKRRKLIRARRTERSAATAQQDLLDSVAGWVNDPWEGRRDQTALEILLRDAGQVEKGLRLLAQGPPKVPLPKPGTYAPAELSNHGTGPGGIVDDF